MTDDKTSDRVIYRDWFWTETFKIDNIIKNGETDMKLATTITINFGNYNCRNVFVFVDIIIYIYLSVYFFK